MGTQGPQPGLGLLQAQGPDALLGGGGHVSLKEGNSGSLYLSGTRPSSRAGHSAPHTPGCGSQPCTSRWGSTSLTPGASVLSPAEWGQSRISSIPSNSPHPHFSISDWGELYSCGTDSSHWQRFPPSNSACFTAGAVLGTTRPGDKTCLSG